MRLMHAAARGVAVALALVALAGCENEIPTATGADQLPNGTALSTIELELPAAEFLRVDEIFGGFVDPADVPYLLVAERFDGALTAHALARFAVPDSVTYSLGGTSRTEAISAFGAGRVVARVDSLASAPRAPTTLRLWALAQPWDSAAVSWEFAVARPGARVPWINPGGTVGALLAEARWVPGDTIAKDSVVFALDSVAVNRLARRDFPGLLLSVATPGARLQISRLALVAPARPAGKPDTALAQRVTQGAQTFIFTPDPPVSPAVLRAGGLLGERSVVRLNLDQTVPACAAPATTPSCPRVPLREVTLNRAVLVLDPVPVPLGFRPLTRATVQLRRVVEPELGRRAPLGELLAQDTVPARLFEAPGSSPVAINLTSALLRELQAGKSTITAAVLADTGTPDFGVLWFDRSPRLRLVYTLPQRPALP